MGKTRGQRKDRWDLIRISRTFIAIASALLCAVTLMTIRCFAYDYSKITGTNASGADISGYSGALEVNVLDFGADKSGKKDSSKAIQKALNYAVDNGSSSIQIKVFVPAGKYKIKSLLKIYSNTWFYLEDGATIIRDFDSGCMLKNAQANGAGGYDSDRNIVIEGGCWDGNPSGSSAPFSNMRFGHMTNLWIKNVEIKNNYNGHHLEIGATKGITIEDCDFHGYSGYEQKEAIQLDTISSSEVFAGYEPFDDTPCDNVVIKNNSFHDLMRGLGSHSACLGVYYTNTIISGNSFSNLKSTAIVLVNHKNCIIENNTMSDVGYGVDFKYMTDNENSNFHIPNSGYAGIKERLDDNANTIIRNNTISTAMTYYISQPFGIQIFGKKLEASANHPDYNYTVKGVKITDNKITTVGSAVRLNDVSGIYIASNEMSFDYDKYNRSDMDLISMTDTSQITVTKNTLTGSYQNCVYVSGGSGSEISSNKMSKSSVSGVYVSGGSEGNTVSGNTISGTGSNGIKVTKKSEADIRKNTVSKSGNHGILFTDSSGKATENKLSENSLNGFLADNGAKVEFRDNTCEKNKNYGIKANRESEVLISGNTLADNGKGNILAAGKAVVMLNAPQQFKASDICSDKLSLQWDTVSQADGYYVYRKSDEEGAEYERIAEVTDTSYTDFELAPKTRYIYKVKAYINTVNTPERGKGSAALNIKTKLTIKGCSTDMLSSMSYTGKERTQMFNVYADEETLIPDVDYRVEYYDNINVGEARVMIIGMGQYCDQEEFTFSISLLSDNVLAISPQSYSGGSIINSAPSMKAQGYEVVLNTKDRLNQGVSQTYATVVNMYSPVEMIKNAREDYPDISVRSYRELTGETIYGAWL